MLCRILDQLQGQKYTHTVSSFFNSRPDPISDSCHVVRFSLPAARCVSFKRFCGVMRANSATRSWGRKVLIIAQLGRPKNSSLHRLPKVPYLNVQLCDSGVDVLSDRTLPVNGERRSSGSLHKFTPDNRVWLSGVAFQLDLDVPFLLGLFHERVQILTPKNLGAKWCW